jgi:hypothetical protein
VELNVPQEPAVGPQLQSTPPLFVSLATDALIVAVPPGAMLEGGVAENAIDMPEGAGFEDDDDTAPQPENNTASDKALMSVSLSESR